MQSQERRRFFEVAGKFGVTTAIVAAAAGTLVSSEAAAQTAKEEKERQTAAKATMTIGTAYRIGTTRSYPIMQLSFKENIQNLTNGHVYVKLAPAGALRADWRVGARHRAARGTLCAVDADRGVATGLRSGAFALGAVNRGAAFDLSAGYAPQ